MAFFDQAAMGFLGAALVTKVTDANIPMVLRAAYAVVGGDMVYRAVAKGNPSGSNRLLGAPEPARIRSTLKFEPRKARTIAERVSFIHEQALRGVRDPVVYELARKTLSRKCGGTWCTPERDSRGEIDAIFGEVRSRVRYTLDPVTYDGFATPGKTLQLGAGDCDDSTSLLIAMLMSVGYECQSRVVWTKGSATYNHIFVRVKLPTGEWLPLDPSVDKPAGWEVSTSMYAGPARDFPVKG